MMMKHPIFMQLEITKIESVEFSYPLDNVGTDNDRSHCLPVIATPVSGDHRLRDENSHYNENQTGKRV
jgi:hypothetical protein